MSGLLYFIVCLSVVINTNEGAKILGVFPIPSISHQVVFRALTLELVRRGHEVTVITTDPAFPEGGGPANLTEIDLHDLSYGIWAETYMKASKGKEADLISDFDIIFNLLPTVFDHQLGSKTMQDFLRDKDRKFDLVMTESCMRPSAVFGHVYKAPLILFNSFGAFLDNNQVIGAPIHPILYPTSIVRKLNNLSMWDKLWELYYFFMIEKMHNDNYILENNVVKKHFGPDTPLIQEIHNNVSMLFLNMHSVFEGNRPVPPAVIYMGGLHQKPDKELPKDLKSYLDSSKNGVIYISFGTNVDPSLLPPEKIQTMVRVVSKLPYDILWKWNKDELPGRTENIRISKWLPQSDLLKHPKVKLFVTQGGLQSTNEAITAGVPLIGMPMLGDQWYNIEKYETHKIGIRLDMETLTEEKFDKAIKTILGDDSYRRNTEKLYRLITDKPMSSLESGVWWTEYVLRHNGASHLRSPAANMSFSEYFELELVLSVLAALLSGLIVFILILRSLYYFICGKVCGGKVASVKSKRS